jgi:hypothetical protein
MRLRPLPLLAACLLASGTAYAQQSPQWWGVGSVGSYHFEDADEYLGPGESFNESNLGAGIEVQWQPRHGVAAGFFHNSVDEDSRYLLYQYTPLSLGRFVRVGGMLGVVDGYPGYNNGDFAPGGGFLLKAEGQRVGANVILLPRIPDSTPWTLGLQVKLRFGR